MDQETINEHSASYRDPSGFVFTYNNELYRQINQVYKKDFELFINSGLYHELTEKSLFIKHEQLDHNFTNRENWFTTLKPEKLSYISYPYEWCFDQLKDAALLTLQIAQIGIEHKMILKDATPFNIQLHKGNLIFIDSLSFEEYDERQPWIAYRQFCEMFLAPLALMYYHQQPFQQLIYAYPEGVPLSIASKLLPWRSRLNLHVYLHIHLQNNLTQKHKTGRSIISFSKQKLLNLFRSLQSVIEGFKFENKGVWSEYYLEAEERSNYLSAKKEMVADWINRLSDVSSAVDVGANEGAFTRILAEKNIQTISVDGDHFAITKLYHSVKGKNKVIYPLIMDITNPSSSIGFNNEERASFSERTRVDLVLALAFIHHLAIGKNIPFEKLSKFFKTLGKELIIEFVPRTDEKIKLMLTQRKDIFYWYTEDEFIKRFSKDFKIIESRKIADSDRTLYLMKSI